MHQRGFLAILFLLGCATGGVASRLVVPPVLAGTHPARWEYQCAQGGGLTGQLAKYGAEGWDLVSVFPVFLDHKFDNSLEAQTFGFCVKRELP